MPEVGGKKYKYTKEGVAKAKKKPKKLVRRCPLVVNLRNKYLL